MIFIPRLNFLLPIWQSSCFNTYQSNYTWVIFYLTIFPFRFWDFDVILVINSTEAMSFIVLVGAFKDNPIGVGVNTKSIFLASLPFSFILIARIFECINTPAISQIFLPLAIINITWSNIMTNSLSVSKTFPEFAFILVIIFVFVDALTIDKSFVKSTWVHRATLISLNTLSSLRTLIELTYVMSSIKIVDKLSCAVGHFMAAPLAIILTWETIDIDFEPVFFKIWFSFDFYVTTFFYLLRILILLFLLLAVNYLLYTFINLNCSSWSSFSLFSNSSVYFFYIFHILT